jgi:hypothetical protein
VGKTIVREIRVELMKNSLVLRAKSNFLFLSGVILFPPTFYTSLQGVQPNAITFG